MLVASPGRPHLAYCTNIHAGETLVEVRDALQSHVVQVKARLGLTTPMGVGLRLSARASKDLSTGDALVAFRELVDRLGLYVFTINGFPYGAFHGQRVKEAVYRPDWLEDERLAYTDRLAWQLSALLPHGVSGSISTVPGAFRIPSGAGGAAGIAARVVEHAATLHRILDRTGKYIELALEPEPCCLLETTEDTVRFFQTHVFSSTAVMKLAALTGLSSSAAEAFLHRHVGMCLDACHLAVEFEDAGESLSRLSAAGIRIGKVQVTTALLAELSGDRARDADLLRELERFDDGVYLHQVVERRGSELIRYLDLPEAILAARQRAPGVPSEWRVHFHVPVFEERLAPFRSTQPFLSDLLARAARAAVSDHFEVETYTWDVLPEEHRGLPVHDAIARELEWTIAAMSFGKPSVTEVVRTSRVAVYLKLGRVSNLPTVWSNTLAGIVLGGGALEPSRAVQVGFALSLFYVGGMFLNDAFDREIDARERPERPIPSGIVSASEVFAVGFSLLAVGLVALVVVAGLGGASRLATALAATALGGCVVLYDAWHKQNPASPVVMGSCRALVYVTAALAAGGTLSRALLLGAVVAGAYVVGLTFVARQENRRSFRAGGTLALIASPIAVAALGPTIGVAAGVMLVLFIAWAGSSIAPLFASGPVNVPRAVVRLIAGISLVDGLLMATYGAAALVPVGLGAFATTLLLQRWVRGT